MGNRAAMLVNPMIVRCRFLDRGCSPAVIAQRIRQQGLTIGQRSVERIIADYGMQKKLYALRRPFTIT